MIPPIPCTCGLWGGTIDKDYNPTPSSTASDSICPTNLHRHSCCSVSCEISGHKHCTPFCCVAPTQDQMLSSSLPWYHAAKEAITSGDQLALEQLMLRWGSVIDVGLAVKYRVGEFGKKLDKSDEDCADIFCGADRCVENGNRISLACEDFYCHCPCWINIPLLRFPTHTYEYIESPDGESLLDTVKRVGAGDAVFDALNQGAVKMLAIGVAAQKRVVQGKLHAAQEQVDRLTRQMQQLDDDQSCADSRGEGWVKAEVACSAPDGCCTCCAPGQADANVTVRLLGHMAGETLEVSRDRLVTRSQFLELQPLFEVYVTSLDGTTQSLQVCLEMTVEEAMLRWSRLRQFEAHFGDHPQFDKTPQFDSELVWSFSGVTMNRETCIGEFGLVQGATIEVVECTSE